MGRAEGTRSVPVSKAHIGRLSLVGHPAGRVPALPTAGIVVRDYGGGKPVGSPRLWSQMAGQSELRKFHRRNSRMRSLVRLLPRW